HAIQMELAQFIYMSEQPPWDYENARADKLRVILGGILANLAATLA
ncbi:MAG: N-formylglutamate deformylase, partial [Halieaceae bacterium]|nr:N-formylglutamate deformylase [Halieaceae bacterium]